ncbi:MAG TPA: lectin-like protein [Verrucomicrobiales bacterium]|nr:lectin-like protein [Verrucomicrobiales bacterium]
MRPLRALILTAVMTAGSPPLSAEPVVPGTFLTAPFGPGGTWNLYQTSKSPLSWVAAQELADKTADPRGGTGKPGHLAVISSAAENMFIYQYALGDYLWIGLTDNERWEGREAGADRAGGWRWVNGEPYTWNAWRSPEPNENERHGEDGVAVERCGRWSDWGIGFAEQAKPKQPFVIEWDTQLPQPVPGCVKIDRVLPAKWPADLLAWKGAVAGSGRWSVFAKTRIDGSNIRTIVAGLGSGLKEMEPPLYLMPRLNYRWPGRPERVGGWVEVADAPDHPCFEGGCGALHVAKVHLDKPGTWSFNVHCDDYFALRLPGFKWKSLTGLGGIDPLDPETIYFDTVSGDGGAIGVIDLPAGDHTIEAVVGNRLFEIMLQIMAAPGEFTMDGATDRWRFPGHKAKEDLAWPGIDEAGWKVTRIGKPEGAKPLVMFEEAISMAESGEPTASGVFDSINFIDSGAAGDIKFPSPVSFPGDKPGNQDSYVIKAEAKLVIPRDGTYHIGIHADDHCGMCIVNHKWNRLIRDTGYRARMKYDTLGEEIPDDLGTNTQIVGEITLTKGVYPIEVVYAEMGGPSVMSVFGGPPGFPPRLLTKNGAKIEPDIDGLPLAAPDKK